MRLLLGLLVVSILQATPTQIVDVLYQPNGNPPAVAALTDITITQTAFVSGNNYYPAFELSPHPVSDIGGNFSIWLEPNPTGQPYTVLYRATNGVITHEFWTVPASNTPLKIKDVRTSVGPLPPLGLVQLSQLAQGGALLDYVIAYNGLNWVASPLGTLGLEVTANKDQASGYAGLTAGTLLKTAEFPAFTGDCTTSAGAVAVTCSNAIARTGTDINTSNQVTATHLASPQTVPQGGTGATTLAAHGTLIGAGTGAVAVGSPGTAGYVWTSNGPSADPTMQPAAGGGATMQRGVYASVPSCTTSQFLYTATNAALQGVCDGASHLDWLYKGMLVTPTVVADLPTWYNQGGASVTSYAGSWALIGTTGAGDNFRGRTKAVPATPYSVVTCMEGLGSNKNYGGFGMFWTDGTKIIVFAYSNQVNSAPPILGINQYSNATSYSGSYVANGSAVSGTGMFCMAMIDDGANRTEKYSFDKQNWIAIHSVGRTDFLTATGVGVVVDDSGGNLPPQVQIVSIETLNSAL